MMAAQHWRTGDAVLIEYEGRRVAGAVQMASGNAKSLMLSFEAILGGHVGMMPVLLDDDGAYYSIMSGKAVSLTRQMSWPDRDVWSPAQ